MIRALTPLVVSNPWANPVRGPSDAGGCSVGGTRAPAEQGAADTQRGDEHIHQAEIDEFPELPSAGTRFADGAIDLFFTAHIDNVIPQGERIDTVEEKI